MKKPDREPDFIIYPSPNIPIGVEVYFWFDEMIYCLDSWANDEPRSLMETEDGRVFVNSRLDKIVRDALEEYRTTRAFEKTILNKSD